MNGERPARVPDSVIDEIQARERNGAIEPPKPRGLRAGDPVRVTRGPLADLHGLYEGQRPHERVLILLQLLGGAQRVELGAGDIKPLPLV
jgi:transcriptional antiterminator RfaH